MTQIFRQGTNWLIINQLSDISDIKDMLQDVDKENYAEFTSAKGKNSKQHYIIPPSWMPNAEHVFPKDWNIIKEKYSSIIQKELVHHGIFPHIWTRLYAKSAWTVKGEEGSWHTIHEHGPNSISTIIYTAIPKRNLNDPPYTSGSVYFVMDGSCYSETSVPATRVMHINPNEGMLIIFPSYMLHGVYPQGPGLRQTLNIDYHGDEKFTYGLGTAGSTNFN